MQKRITLRFQKFCGKNDIITSKRVERLMNKELENNKKRGGK